MSENPQESHQPTQQQAGQGGGEHVRLREKVKEANQQSATHTAYKNGR